MKSLNAKLVLLALASLVPCGPWATRLHAAADGASSNPPPRLVVAVLPFENATGDTACNDWRLAFPALVRSCLGGADSMSLPGGKKLQPVLERSDWTDAKAVDATLARQVARELKAGFAVWGSFQRRTNGWVLEVRVLRTDSDVPPENIRPVAPSPVKLAEPLARRLAALWDRPLAGDAMERWRMLATQNDAAAAKLAHALALESHEAPAAEQEQAWREVLAADPRCGMTYSALIDLLTGTGQDAEINKLVQQHVRLQPRSCAAHAANGLRLLVEKDEAGAEAELREALRLHPSCSNAVRTMFKLLANSDRWADLVVLMSQAHASQPGADSFRILLADALAQTGDFDGARDLLDSLKDLPPEDELVDKALLQAAFAAGRFELAGRELLRLGSQAATNKYIRSTLDATTVFIGETGGKRTNGPIVRPRSLTPAELNAELARRLTPQERALVVNPLEITPALTAEAQRLVVGITNESLRSVALFAEVAQRGRGSGDGGRRTASEALKDSGDPQTRFACQEYAKLFVALARGLGLEAWLVHIELCADGSFAYHDCAALFLDGQGFLIDPTWRVFGISHQAFTVLDDVQTISHQAMQLAGKPDPRRLRLGLKLNPEDRWTRLQFVRGMAEAGELDTAAEELRKVQAAGVESWDVHEAAAELEIARARWQPALAELLRAVALNPSNPVVHVRLARVYGQLNDSDKATAHMEKAIELDRGELSREFRRERTSEIKIAKAIARGSSGDPAVRADLQRQAESGDLAAQIALAKALLGQKPPRTEEGMRWNLMAAKQGEDQAQFHYAKNLLLLRGDEAAPEAVKWLNKSAAQGNDEAQYLLGLILYEGKLVAEDRVAAGQWILLAAAADNTDARRLFKEMQLFLSAGETAEARQRAASFKPVKQAAALPRKPQ